MSVFSDVHVSDYLLESDFFYVIYDKYPVSKGHALIVSKKVKTDFFTLNHLEQSNLIEMINNTKKILDETFIPDAYNIGMNCGAIAGQTVMHFHCHIIPRYNGDMKDPKGGVRHCVEGKGYYL